MKLRRLSIDRLPGIDHPFELKELGDGLNLIIGPNGIGKSSVCSAVRALLWQDRRFAAGAFAARGSFAHEGADWTVVRDGSLHAWQRAGLDVMGPNLPGEPLEDCFFLGLRDLLDDSDRAGRNLAGEIRRQMSGGFDLESIHEAFQNAAPPRGGSRENKELAEAEREILRAQRNQIEIERSEGELAALASQADVAERAARRQADVKAAIELQRLRQELDECDLEWAELPRSLARLDGREIARLDKLDEELVRNRADRQAADQVITASRAAAEATRLDAPIDRVDLTTWQTRADELAELDRRLDTANKKRSAALERVTARRRWLGADAERAERFETTIRHAPDVDDDAALFAFLRESENVSAEKQALTERLRLLASRSFPEEDASRLALLKRAVGPLRAWLRAPRPIEGDGTERFWRTARFQCFAGLGVALIGGLAQFIATAEAIVASGLVVLGLGLGLIAAGLARGSRGRGDDSTDWRTVARRQFPESLDPPERWEEAAVERRLQQLEDELSNLDTSEKRARDRLVERGQLEETLNGLEARSSEIAERRQALANRLGLAELRPDIDLVDLVDLATGLADLRNATDEATASQAEVETLETARGTLLSGLAAAFAGRNAPEPRDTASCRAVIGSLEERDRALRAATVDLARESARGERLDAEILRLEESRDEIFERAGVARGDRLELTRLIETLPRFVELKAQRADLTRQIERAVSSLEDAGESQLVERETGALEDELAALEAEAKGRDALIARIAEIRQRARDAREGNIIEAAIARRSAALSALRDRRDEVLAAEAGRFLIDGVRREHETNQMPRVLARARDRFGVFTHHRYELKVSPDGGGSFVAIEGASGRGLRPEQLSDGTRAQLILAARLAFAEEAEQGADLPIFLDEAMDHSDPERFHAIAASLARMVSEDDRQIFYLSNDPTDVERFERAFAEVGCKRMQTIDLGAIRGQVARVESPVDFHVEPLATVPSPDGFETAAEYAVAVGVGRLDPHADARSHHLYFVLKNDLALLHDLLVARITTVGQWSNLAQAGSDFAKGITTRSAAGAQLADRIALLETFCLAWREGRGLPVGRAEIEASRAVGDKYLDVVVDMAAEQDGDAARLLAALHERSDGRLRGFRKKSTEQLERYFEERGFVDAKPVLGEADIVERALGTPAANRLAPGVAAELVHTWWAHV